MKKRKSKKKTTIKKSKKIYKKKRVGKKKTYQLKSDKSPKEKKTKVKTSQNHRWNLLRNILISLAGFACLCLMIFSLLFVLQRNKILWRSQVGFIKVGNLTKEQASEKIQDHIEDLQNQKLTLTNDKTNQEIPFTELGITFEVEKSKNEVFSKGHTGTFLSQFIERITSLFDKNYAPLYLDTNEEELKNTLKTTFPNIERAKVDSHLSWNNNQLEIIPAQNGIKFDIQRIKNQLKLNIKKGEIKNLELTFIEESVIDKSFILNQKKIKLEAIVNKKTTLTSSGYYQEINSDQKKEWFDLSSDESLFNDQAITKTLNEFANTIRIEPVNAELGLNNNKVIITNTGQDGRELNIDKSVEIVKQTIQQNDQIPLLAEPKQPTVNQNTLTNLGLTQQISTAETFFAGSGWSRVKNIQTGANKIHGHLIKPNEEFSIIEAIGPVTYEAGFKDAPIIIPGAVENDIGGGLCQVSTTMFQTAINAGLQISERWPHSFIVSYYGTPGSDAAIYPPYKDLKFKNNTPGHILIQTRATDTSLAFDFFGTPDGRQIKIVGPHLSYPGNGYTNANLTIETYNNNQLINTQSFESSYKPRSEFETRT